MGMKREAIKALWATWAEVLAGAMFLLLVVSLAAVFGHGALISKLGRLAFNRELAVLGFLTLGQTWIVRHGEVDLSAPAQVALATVLVVGLGQVWGALAAVLAAVAVGQVVAISAAVTSARWRLPAAWVTLVPLVVFPALLPQQAAPFAPPAVEAFVTGEVMGQPYPFVVWLLAMLLAAAVWHRAEARAAGFAAAGLCWSLIGVWLAGRYGAVTDVAPLLVDTGLGLGLAWLVSRRPETSLLAGGVWSMAVSAALVSVTGPALFRPWLAASVMLAGLAVRASSTDAEDLRLDAVGRQPAAVDNLHGDPPDLVGLEEPHRGDG